MYQLKSMKIYSEVLSSVWFDFGLFFPVNLSTQALGEALQLKGMA